MSNQIFIYYTGIGANHTFLHSETEFITIFMNNYHLFNYEPNSQISYNYIHNNINNFNLTDLCSITGAEIRTTIILSN